MKTSTVKILIATGLASVGVLVFLPIAWAVVGLIIIGLVAYNSAVHPDQACKLAAADDFEFEMAPIDGTPYTLEQANQWGLPHGDVYASND